MRWSLRITRPGSTLFYILFFVTLENPTRSFPFLPSFLPSWNWTPFYHTVFLGRTLDSEIADEMRLWRECTIILTGTRVTRIIRNHTSLLSQLVFTFKYMAIYQWSECWISVCSCIRMLTCMEARMSFITFSLYLSSTLAKIYTIVCTHTSARTHAPPPFHTYTYSVAFIYYDNSYDDMISNIIAAFIIRMNIHTITLQLF